MFCESMFGATEMSYDIKEDDILEFKVDKTSNICIDIIKISGQEKITNHKSIEFRLVKIIENNKEKSVISDEININKIYKKLEPGNYKLSFKLYDEFKFKCKIKYYKEEIIIKKEGALEITNFSNVKKINDDLKFIYNLLNFSRNR